jgi:hypothetical protein
MAVTAVTQLAARVVHGCVLDHVRVASSASLRLTAKPHDTRDPQGMTLDAYIRPELHRCYQP